MLRSSALLALLLLLQAVLAVVMGPGGGDDSTTLIATSAVTVTLSAPPAAGTTSPNGTRTQPAVTPPAPSMALATPSNATTCTPATFRWHTTTTNVTLRLFITNDKVQQSAPSPNTTTPVSAASAAPDARHATTTPITRAITNDTALAAGLFSWPAVSVPSGWYTLLASLASEYPSQAIAQSAPFYVMAGSNTSCVYPAPSTLEAQSHSPLTPGALAGTVVGSVVGAAALLGAFALPRLWRRGVPGHQAWKDKRGGLYRVF